MAEPNPLITVSKPGAVSRPEAPAPRWRHASLFFDHPNLLLVLVVAAFGVASLLWGELLPVNGGFGWDGMLYKEIAQK